MTEPRGFRDVYWCWIVNEPGFIHWPEKHAVCSRCHWVDDATASVEQRSELFLTEHTFVAHIEKPKQPAPNRHDESAGDG